MGKIRSVAFGAVIAFAWWGSPFLFGQPRVIRGVVRDPSGRGVEGAEIQVRGRERTVTTGPDGTFRIDRVGGSFWLVARHSGFRSAQLDGRLKRHQLLEVGLTMAPGLPESGVADKPLLDRVRDQIWRSRASALGWILAESDLAKRKVATLDALWSAGPSRGGAIAPSTVSYPLVTPLSDGAYRVPAAPSPGPGSPNSPEPSPTWQGASGTPLVSMFGDPTPSFYAEPVRCSPAVSLNGAEISADLLLEDIAPGAVRAVEIYAGTRLPVSEAGESLATRRARCGVVVVWQKEAPSIAGEWDAAMNTPGGVGNFKIIFEQSGDSLTGTVKRQAGDVPLVGTIKDNIVRFSYTINYNGSPLQLTVTATVTGDSMTGKIAFGVAAEDDFSAKRTTPTRP